MALSLNPENDLSVNVGGVNTPVNIALENTKKIAEDAIAKESVTKTITPPETPPSPVAQPHPLAQYANGYEALRKLSDENFKHFVDNNPHIPGIGYVEDKKGKFVRTIENPADRPPETQMMTLPQMAAVAKIRAAETAEKKLGIANEHNRVLEAHYGVMDNKKPKPTATIAINPETNKEEYINTDGSFSGLIPGRKPSIPTNINIKRVSDMVKAAGDEPTPNDVATINEAANTIGYNYENVAETKPGILWGTNTTNSWKLIKKDEGKSMGVGQPSVSESKITVSPSESKIPVGAQTGAYKGIRAYTTDNGKTFYDMNGKKL